MARPTREQMEAQLVELIATQSAAEAESIAVRLRGEGIIALANVEQASSGEPGGRGYGGHGFRAFVLVHEVDLDRARDALDRLLGSEGEVPDEVIEAEMAAAQQDPDAATAWYDERESRSGKRVWMARDDRLQSLVILACLGAFVWLLVQWMTGR